MLAATEVVPIERLGEIIGKANAYLVWGIDDKTHEVNGTSFVPGSSKIGNEELENWLLQLLDPKIN